ncbi:YkgB family protein [Porphyromonas crevioricanis]|uniref:YkgB family protein n=1 Tax=Porphyromonas crevioricanis TaxID=393921 RepID=UPI0021CECCEF|nr:YkgB family protein [Porphyromonas crevioricanis]
MFKFTPMEAAAIRPLLEHHPITFWVYDVFGVQFVSILVGLAEISVALLLLLSIRVHSLRRYAGLGITFIFLFTLSFLFFTSGMWKVRDGVLITDYFILKDIAYLGFGLMLLDAPKNS